MTVPAFALEEVAVRCAVFGEVLSAFEVMNHPEAHDVAAFALAMLNRAPRLERRLRAWTSDDRRAAGALAFAFGALRDGGMLEQGARGWRFTERGRAVIFAEAEREPAAFPSWVRHARAREARR